MKIGLVCPYNILKGGGVQECVLALQAELTKRGHKVLIITPTPMEKDTSIPEYVRTLGRGRDVKSPFSTTAQISVTVDMDLVEELLDKEKFDVLHFHEPWVPLISHQILTRSKAKNIATFHAKLPDTVMSRTIEKVITPYTKTLLKYFDNMTAVSEAAASYVTSISQSKIAIVPNGINLKVYNKLPIVNAKQKTILYIGRLEKRKGLKYLLKAFSILQETNKDVILKIAGDGSDRQKLERYAVDHNLPVEFLGRVSEDTKLKLLHESTIFCSPARYGESFGIVLLEAMACGLPVVAGDNPGYSGVLQGTGRFSLVDPTNTAEFARKLDIFINDQAVRKAWLKWADENVKQYNYQNITDQYEAIYQKT